jgi:hypothetical protein
MEFLDMCLDELENDPTLITVIANLDFGRYLLQGTSWSGKFDVTAGSESRNLILKLLG